MVFLFHFSGYASKRPRHPVPFTFRRKQAGALASAPGQTHPFISLARSHAVTRTHARTHRPLPSTRSLGTSGVNSCSCPGIALGLSAARVVPLLTSECPPRLPAHSLDFLAGPSFGAPVPAPRTLWDRAGSRPAPDSPRPQEMPRGSRWSPGPAEGPGAQRGSQTRCAREGSVAPRRGAVPFLPGPSTRSLGLPSPAAAKPGHPGEQGADPGARASGGQGEAPTSQGVGRG